MSRNGTSGNRFSASSKSSSSPIRLRSGAFSLFELLLVVVLTAVLIGILLGAYSSMIQSSGLSAAAGSLCDLLTEARTDAMTENTPVEVRLYDLPGSSDPTLAYRALQLHWMRTDGTRPAIDNLFFLPATVVMDATAQHSSIIGSDPVTATSDASDPHMNAQTRVFHFLADGSTDLTSSAAWFLTLRAATQLDPAHFPSNWSAVTVDPVTGRAQIFRP